jgi:glycosyltransferase involved in cell wall biosynthesis
MFAPVIIVHSKRNTEIFCSYGYKNQIILFDHLRYDIDREYEYDQVSEDVRRLFPSERITLLFFGHIRLSKGIDILLAAARRLPGIYSVIVAGNDSDGILNRIQVPGNVVVINRVISDNDLRYLFSHCDCVVLPYRQVSQSGVLEMALHFEKVAIVSDLPIFREMIDKRPELGFVYGHTTDDLVDFLTKFVSVENGKVKMLGSYHSSTRMQVDIDELVSYILSHQT